MDFIDTPSDVLEQRHFTSSRQEMVDYMMFVPAKVLAGEVAYLRVVKIQQFNETEVESAIIPSNSLQVNGVTDEGEILFEYANKEQGFSQRFGFNLKYYKGFRTDNPQGDLGVPDGTYVFKTDYKNLHPFQYSTLDKDVQFEHGKFVD